MSTGQCAWAAHALLTEPSHALAAKKAGVSEASLYRWLLLEEFQRAYRKAREALVDDAVARLQQTATEAVAALRRNLSCGRPAAEVTAARAVLEQAFKGAELLDLIERVEKLEQRLKDMNR